MLSFASLRPLLIICMTLAAPGLAAHAQNAAVPADGFTGIWYQITGGTSGEHGYANKYGGGMATYPQQIAPLAIYRPQVNKTFFTFNLDPGDGSIRHALSYFDHDTGLVARPQIWLDKRTGDAHDASTLAIDQQGYLYQFSMSHGVERQSFIRRSIHPYDISGYVGLLSAHSPEDLAVFGSPADNPDPQQAGRPNFSYASAWYRPHATEDDKFLLLHTRYVNGDRDLFTTTSADADTWTPRRTFAQIEQGQYQTSWIKPDGNTVGTIFNVHPDGVASPLDSRADLYYLQTGDGARTWQSADGLTVVDHGSENHPLTRRPGGHALAYASDRGERVYLKDVNYDPQGNPVILFLTSPTSDPGPVAVGQPPRRLRTARWTGERWDLQTVTTTDHNYDHGSLYIRQDAAGQTTWTLIGPWLEGPQASGTGGEIGMWTSQDLGHTWSVRALTQDSTFNHSYVRRPLDAHDDLVALWSDGHAFQRSDVGLLFANRDGQVFRLPTAFEPGQDFAPPLPVAVPEPSGILTAAPLTLGSLLMRRPGSAAP